MCNNKHVQYKQYYGNLIWTHHAIERMRNRGLTQDMARETFKKPDKIIPGKTHGSFEYQKQFDSSRVTLIAKQNEKYEWIVLSAWIDPPLPGSNDAKQKAFYHLYQKAGFWKKLWLAFRQQTGI